MTGKSKPVVRGDEEEEDGDLIFPLSVSLAALVSHLSRGRGYEEEEDKDWGLDGVWIPACAGMTEGRGRWELDSRFGGWILAFAGMTRRAPG